MRLTLCLLGVLLTGGLFWFMATTRTGRAIRATRIDLEAAQLMGVSPAKIYATTFGISAALAGAAGALVSTGFAISPVTDVEFLAKAFYFGPGLQNALGYAVLLIVLFIRPSGLLGRAGYH